MLAHLRFTVVLAPHNGQVIEACDTVLLPFGIFLRVVVVFVIITCFAVAIIHHP